MCSDPYARIFYGTLSSTLLIGLSSQRLGNEKLISLFDDHDDLIVAGEIEIESHVETPISYDIAVEKPLYCVSMATYAL